MPSQVSEHQQATDNRCLNCDTPLTGQFCAECGQNRTGVDRFLLSIINELFDNIFSRHSRPFITLRDLLFRPGRLTKQYFEGRRVSYVQPLRLYLVTSITFFFLLSLQTMTEDAAIRVIEDGDSQAWESGVTTNFEDLSFDSLSEQDNVALREWLAERVKIVTELLNNNPGLVAERFLELVPQIMFFLVPLFAALMKMFYLFSGHYYTEHLVFSVHNHCFVFVALIIDTALGWITMTPLVPVATFLGQLLNFWVVVYMYLALRVYYQQGHFLTLIKYLGLSLSYFTLFGIGVLVALAWGVISL